MKLFFGYNKFDLRSGKETPIIWDSTTVINHHMLIAGGSGTGKTHLLRNIINQTMSSSSKVRIHIIDFHGDIEIPNSSTIKFSESTSYGFNPLIVSDDPHFGGVRKRVQSFIKSLNRAGRQLGTKQEAALRNLLTDLYAANGFYANDPKSWKLEDGVSRKFPKKYPTLNDALKFSSFKLNAMSLGANNKAMATLEQLNRTASRMYAKLKRSNSAKDDEAMQKAVEELEEIKLKAITEYTDYVNSIKTGNELGDLVKYDSKDVLKSIVERLENLNSMGIFKNEMPPFDKDNQIWRYEISSLLLEEKTLFVNFLLENIFAYRFSQGVQTDVQEIIVLDEAHVYFTDEAENIINIIAKEARKFGLGLICASQSPTHFSEDFMTNVSCKAILGIDETYWANTEKKLNIPSKNLSYIIPQKDMLIQIKNKKENRSVFLPCSFRKS